MSPNEISINRIANGWLVRLPVSGPDAMQMMGMDAQSFQNIIKGIVPGMTDELEDIRNAASAAEATEATDEVKVSADNSLFFFKKFPDVIGFLQYKIKN
jgi:hypothetical protein